MLTQRRYPRQNTGMSNEEMLQYAPAIGTLQKSPNASARYTHFNTLAASDAMREAGYSPVEVWQTPVLAKYQQEWADYSSHMISFRPDDALWDIPETMELKLATAHHPGKAWKLYLGWWRQICSNGMILWMPSMGITIAHSGHTTEDVMQATRAARKMKVIACGSPISACKERSRTALSAKAIPMRRAKSIR